MYLVEEKSVQNGTAPLLLRHFIRIRVDDSHMLGT
jgi:hypothetical protein